VPGGNRIFRAWIVSGLIAFACWIAASAVGFGIWIIPGLIFLGWGLAISTNWRGAADAMPKTSGIGPFTTTTSSAMLRLIFGGFALFGAGIVVAGIVALAR
jgi:hypothetical protein